ncbi:hypothetical protein PoB_001589400 [Plakobranchus ocellatus]|uniref:Uncharacterized protein n=1 Tax=Plakobranchus ocellatus TaxID=259542 RepID=A0AAV3Z4U9_9GAST|nr:hypothetical protein PoB_001589400 [Plakobranchus ocellatus]
MEVQKKVIRIDKVSPTYLCALLWFTFCCAATITETEIAARRPGPWEPVASVPGWTTPYTGAGGEGTGGLEASGERAPGGFGGGRENRKIKALSGIDGTFYLHVVTMQPDDAAITIILMVCKRYEAVEVIVADKGEAIAHVSGFFSSALIKKKGR